MDLFEQRLKSLRLRRPTAEFGEPATLMSRIKSIHAQPGLLERIKQMSWKSKVAAIMGMAASVLMAYVVLTNAGNSVAFAQVVEKIRAAHTLSYDWISKRASDGKIVGQGRNLYQVPGKVRIQIKARNGQQNYIVLDANAGKVLMVDEKNKTASILPFKKSEEADKAVQAIKRVQSLDEEQGFPIGTKKIGSVLADGFQFERDDQFITVWVNSKTGELFQVDLREKDPAAGTTHTWTNIELNPVLDAALFSIDPAPGFKVDSAIPLDGVTTPAHLVAEFLKIYAKHMGGRLPEKLQDAALTLRQKMPKPQPNQLPSAEMMKLPFYVAAVASVTRRSQGTDWQYFANRQKNDGNEMIFWFNDKHNDVYWGVFGDFHVAQVAPDQLPKE